MASRVVVMLMPKKKTQGEDFIPTAHKFEFPKFDDMGGGGLCHG
jgi:hypothetical protein